MNNEDPLSLSFLYQEDQCNLSNQNLPPSSLYARVLNYDQFDMSLNAISKNKSGLSPIQISKNSSDLHESWKYSKEVSDILQGHHLYAPSVLVKSGSQNYNGLLNEFNEIEQSGDLSPSSQDLEEGSIDYSLTDEDNANKETVVNLPTEKPPPGYLTPNSKISPGKGMRTSTVYTNLSSDSSVMITSYLSNNSSKLPVRKISQLKPEPEAEFEVIESKPKLLRPDKSVHASIRKSTLAFPNLLYCPTCNEDTYSNISFQVQNLGFVDSIKFFFQAFRCCREANSLSKYQEIVHTCRKCKNILARVRAA